jgi:hypothetical protein
MGLSRRSYSRDSFIFSPIMLRLNVPLFVSRT